MMGSQLGKWTIEKELGRGGMGRVYLARAEPDGQRAAIKVLSADLAQEAGFVQRFQREIDTLSQLNHPNIVRFYEAGTHENVFYYAMEYVDGVSFEDLLLEKGRLPWKEVVATALEICPALKHAHDRGIIHRDIKPANLLRTAEGMVKLTDFGIAKVFASQQLTATGGIVGTAEFLSPEQAAGKPVTKRSDLYSLGVVLYMFLTGRPPFEGESTVDLLHKHRFGQFDTPRKLVPEIPYELDELVCQLLEKEPGRRPADALMLQRHLEAVQRRLGRKALHTNEGLATTPTLSDNILDKLGRKEESEEEEESEPGPATLMSRLMRRELHRMKHGGPVSQWFNTPWVLGPLFVLVMGLIIWGFWPKAKPDAETLFAAGAELMNSDNPEDWDRAQRQYFEPLMKAYPDNPHREEVEQFRQQTDDRASLRLAIWKLRLQGTPGEGQRFYQRGVQLVKQGDVDGARRVWRDLIRSFGTVEAEQRWVGQARDALADLDKRAPAVRRDDTPAKAALERARELRDAGKRRQAEEIWSGLEGLYGNDPAAGEILKELRRDRGS
jgi:serine/threonine-protein kinase